MRRFRRWLIATVVLAIIVGGAVAFYFTFVDTAYSKAELYQDTGLSPDRVKAGICFYEEKPGRVILALERGEPHGIITSFHGSIERIAVEMPRPVAGDRVDVTGPEIVVSFLAILDGRIHWNIGQGGVRGHFLIESVSERRITASYEIVVDAYIERLLPEHRKREVVFQGKATFGAGSRPVGEHFGDLWPRPVPPNKAGKAPER